MSHVTPETARRLKDAGFQQPEKPGIGQAWIFDIADHVLTVGSVIEIQGIPIIMGNAEVFCPTATDIMQHLPGWALEFTENEWICYYRETGFDDFVGHRNPAEAAAEAWFFEQSHAKK